MKKLLLLLIISGFCLSVPAQDSSGNSSRKADRKAEKRQRINAITKQEEEGTLSFAKQSALGVQLRTNGYGLFYELGKRRSARFTNLYTIELSEIKHNKEEKLHRAESFERKALRLFGRQIPFGRRCSFLNCYSNLRIGRQSVFG